MSKDKKNISFFEKLKYKYRLIVINDETFEQKASLKLSRFNLYVAIGSFILLMIILITSLISFTNLKYYLPGVGTLDFRHKISHMNTLTDSLNVEIDKRNHWIENFQKVLSGNIDESFYSHDDTINNKINVEDIDLSYLPESDEELREEVAQSVLDAELYNKIRASQELSNAMIFPDVELKINLRKPLEGHLINEFNPIEEHYGIDIAGNDDEPIKAMYKGIVILAEWNPKTGHVIAIQHPNNMISFYKHNSKLLKKMGTFVEKGEAIAIIGSSGEFSSGPHLHIEIWQNGRLKDPASLLDYENIKEK